ncbi:hypothetical protein [Marinobacter shengliensis]|uniref:hypothetical protein n=1 Tax=Marinobacter shengliensis TaxID=1389223 RepID=UPI001486EDF7|nr:hypothetical protein [Marinobacter shengliensis]
MDAEQFERLLQVIADQTSAVRKLAETNAALIQALADGQELEEVRGVEVYLDEPTLG